MSGNFLPEILVTRQTRGYILSHNLVPYSKIHESIKNVFTLKLKQNAYTVQHNWPAVLQSCMGRLAGGSRGSREQEGAGAGREPLIYLHCTA